eukprot:Nk52_evm15s123 gene=Nk52_evmTU15s123
MSSIVGGKGGLSTVVKIEALTGSGISKRVTKDVLKLGDEDWGGREGKKDVEGDRGGEDNHLLDVFHEVNVCLRVSHAGWIPILWEYLKVHENFSVMKQNERTGCFVEVGFYPFLASCGVEFAHERVFCVKKELFAMKRTRFVIVGGRKCVLNFSLNIDVCVDRIKWEFHLRNMKGILLWGWKILGILVKKMKLTGNSLWLSTLGGAHSALGEYHGKHATKAGQLALKQWRLAQELGDDLLGCKCILFLGYSLMQQDRLEHAQRVLESLKLTDAYVKDKSFKLMHHNATRKLHSKKDDCHEALH